MTTKPIPPIPPQPTPIDAAHIYRAKREIERLTRLPTGGEGSDG